jgi:hypothetical protein
MAGRLGNRRLGQRYVGRMLRDRGIVLTYSSSGDNVYHYPSAAGITYTPAGASIRCNYVDGKPEEDLSSALGLASADGVLYVELVVALSSQDRFQLTHRDGRPVPKPITLQLVGEPQPDALLLRCVVKTIVENPAE